MSTHFGEHPNVLSAFSLPLPPSVACSLLFLDTMAVLRRPRGSVGVARLFGGGSTTTDGSAAQCAAPTPDSPSGDAAGQLMIDQQTYGQHVLEAATPFRGAPPTDYRKAGPLPQGWWMEPKGPVRQATRGNYGNLQTQPPHNNRERRERWRARTGAMSRCGRCRYRRRSGGSPVDGVAEGEEAREAHAASVQAEPTTAPGGPAAPQVGPEDEEVVEEW